MPQIVFVNPPRVGFHFGDNIEPLGILSLSAYLKKHGVTTALIDADYEQIDADSVVKRIISSGTNIVGISTTFPTEPYVLDLLNKIKTQNPKIKTILGGVHATLCSDELIKKSDSIDVIVRGEGEVALHEVVQELGGDNPDFSKIQGVTFKKENRIISTEERTQILNLDDYPIPDRSILPKDFYNKTKTAYVMTSRGCAYKCKFCASPILWQGCRLRSVNHVMQELHELKYKYGIQHLFFWDDILPIKKQRMIDLCNEMKGALSFTWGCYNRAELNDIETFKAMKKGGCLKIKYGVESSNPTFAKLMWKDSVLANIETAVSNTRKAGIFVHNSYQIGLPNETRESIRGTLELSKHLSPDYAYFFLFIPYKGTPMFKDAEPYIIESDFSKYWLFNSIIKLPTFTHSELLRELYNMWYEFYSFKGLDMVTYKEGDIFPEDIVNLIYYVQSKIYPQNDLTRF